MGFKVKKEFADRGCYFLTKEETEKVRKDDDY